MWSYERTKTTSDLAAGRGCAHLQPDGLELRNASRFTRGFLINQTLHSRIWLRLLLHTPQNLPLQTECFKNRFLSFTSYVLTVELLYFISAIDSLGNCISIYIDYNPLLRMLRGKIHCCKTRFRFKTYLCGFWTKNRPTACPLHQSMSCMHGQ